MGGFVGTTASTKKKYILQTVKTVSNSKELITYFHPSIFIRIISLVILTVLCFMVFVIRHMFRHKGSYHTNEAKGADSANCADAAIIVNDPAFTETIDESKKEWFI
uniref:Neurexin/syndecan/glycophorin C domain-containing protein n=1 Tax=Poecilia mexicana TaxID=48701 RepID=A0A3B3Y745_9TELE